MNNAQRWKCRFFLAWQDEQEEAWLREMARQGWHLNALGIPGFYHFECGEPRDVAYRLDFHYGKIDRRAYMQLFDDAGWEHLGQMGGWEYFRKHALSGEEPEIYTDPSSKAEKYQRLRLFLLIFLPIMLVALGRFLDLELHGLSAVTTFFMGGVFILWGYALLRISKRIHQLRSL